MKIKSSNKYALTKIKSLPTKPPSSTRILTQRLTDQPKRTEFQVSFDSFFYQDHVTLKKYSIDHLRHLSALKKQSQDEPGNEKWKQEQKSQMVKLIEYIDLWKNIKSNRNNILVYGNKKNNSQMHPTQKKISWNFDKDEENSIVESTAFGTERANTTDNPFIPTRPSHVETHHGQSENKSKSKSKSKLKHPDSALHSQSVGKLKRKINFQMYKLNKELLRDYLSSNKQYDSSFNYLIKDQGTLQSKLNKITTLIDLLKKQKTFNENIINRLSENTLNNIQDPNFQDSETKNQISHSHNPKSSQTFRVRTEITESQSPYFSKGDISLKRLKQTYKRMDRCEEPSAKKKLQAPQILKKKANKHLYRREQEESKIEKAFDKEWQNINQQIKLKFRREAEYSLNIQNRKKKIQS